MSAKKALYEMKSECSKDDFCMQFTCFGEKSGNVTRVMICTTAVVESVLWNNIVFRAKLYCDH